MEDPQIDEWFEREKEKLASQFKERISKGKNLNIAGERKSFEKKFKNLCADYNKKHDQRFKKEEMDKKMHEPIKKFYDFMDEMVKMFKEGDE